MDLADLRRRLPHLELAGVLLILASALVPRARDLGAGFDREFDGAQGGFFAIAAVNYERFGVGRFRGYPALLVDTGSFAPDELSFVDALVYANHPPLVPLMGWLALRAVGPQGWGEAWREQRAPDGIELPLRLPFFLFHVAGLVAFWWVIREGFGAATAMIGLALYTQMPVTILYAGLVNYENPSLPFALLAVGLYARLVKGAGPRALVGLGLALLAGCAFTFAPLFFLPPLVLHALARRRPGLALRVALAGGLGAALPILAHAWATAPAGLSIAGRARVLVDPLLDGTYPLVGWVANQTHAAWTSFGPALTVCAAAGLVLLSLRNFVPGADARLRRHEVRPPSRTGGEERVDVVTPLCLGGLAYLFFFYRHTFEEQRPFLLYAAPGAAAAAAFLCQQVARPLFALRAGIAPMVVLVASLALAGSPAYVKLHRAYRSAETGGPGDPEEPLPRVRGGEIAEILPAGTTGLVPAQLGTTPAHAFYAWRNLIPCDDPLGAPPPILAARVLASARTLILVPADRPSSAAVELDWLSERLLTEARVAASTERWIAWQRP